jgi:transglutaminase-like putative cysteine protease
MGIPKNQLRFVRGMRFEPGKKGNHIWMEVRLEKNGEWLEFDATPKLERPTKSNREIYIYDQEVITDFISAVENPAS